MILVVTGIMRDYYKVTGEEFEKIYSICEILWVMIQEMRYDIEDSAKLFFPFNSLILCFHAYSFVTFFITKPACR